MKKLIVTTLFLAVALPAQAALLTNLKYGMVANDSVAELQEYLIAKGFMTGEATGNFKFKTFEAVKKYQKEAGLPITGYVGPLTRGEINTDLMATETEIEEPEVALDEEVVASTTFKTTAPDTLFTTPSGVVVDMAGNTVLGSSAVQTPSEPTPSAIRIIKTSTNNVYSGGICQGVENGAGRIIYSIEVLDQDGKAMPNKEVTYTTSEGTTGVLKTDAVNKRVILFYEPKTLRGNVSVTATHYNVSATTEFTVTPMPADRPSYCI